MTDGSLTLNGVSDQQLVPILEAKAKHEGVLYFEPQLMRPHQPPQPGRNVYQPVPPQPQPIPIPAGGELYDNVVLRWNNEDGLNVVIDILAVILGHYPVQTGPQPPKP